MLGFTSRFCRLGLALAALCTAPLAASGEDLVFGMSKNKVAITANFDGSDILVFGAIRREAPLPEDSEVGVIVTVAGPSRPVVVRRKARRFGIWVNTESVEMDKAPSFYAVATSGPLNELLSETDDITYGITVGQAIRPDRSLTDRSTADDFTEAVIRIRENADLYQRLEGAVALNQQTLFHTEIALPANLTEGDYQTRIYLTRKGEVISHIDAVIDVHKVGLERFLYNLSREQPLVYGLLSLAIAIAAGWGASAAFRLFRK